LAIGIVNRQFIGIFALSPIFLSIKQSPEELHYALWAFGIRINVTCCKRRVHKKSITFDMRNQKDYKRLQIGDLICSLP
jgi:hypothetical protein